MRRLVASLVIAVMAWSFVGPAALAATGRDAPACCRRSGKHHCMSGTSAVSPDGLASLRAGPSDCRYRSQIATPTGVPRAQSPTISALELPFLALLLAVESRLSDSRLATCNSQRGPPPFGSSQL